jgi:hypothetical protein
MAAIVQALDNFTPTCAGENGHTELAWSNDIDEKIVQFDFQCVRTDANGLESLSLVLNSLLSQLSVNRSDAVAEQKRKDSLVTLYKLIGKTRDIEGGKGEYSISFMMIWIWFQYFPIMAEFALALFVVPPASLQMKNRETVSFVCGTGDTTVPYGSWKDMKYFCDFVRNKCNSENHRLIDVCVHYTNSQLRQDVLDYEDDIPSAQISLVSKWIPREKSKFGWLHKKLALDYFPEYKRTAEVSTLNNSLAKAEKKCLTHYRMLYAKLNRHLDTVQIKQTSKNWASIDHSKTTSITMAKQRKAFLNQKKAGSEPRTEDPDRINCADNLRAYMDSLKKEGKEVKGKNVGLEMFTAQARELIPSYYCPTPNQDEIDILNSQWRDNSSKKNANGLGPMVAMVDMSGSMEGDPMNAAIALGCRVAEKSLAGKRVMTFSNEPAWVNLEGCDTFTQMVKTIVDSSSSAGMNTNFYKALDMILTVIEERRISPADVENMILAIFSDMQIDANLAMAEYGNYSTRDVEPLRIKMDVMFQQIKARYAEVGMRLYGQPLNPPHILFWNLRVTNGFPCLSSESNCSMMSGYDPTILNEFCDSGLQALKDFTPYKMLLKLLGNERYEPMETAMRGHLDM